MGAETRNMSPLQVLRNSKHVNIVLFWCLASQSPVEISQDVFVCLPRPPSSSQFFVRLCLVRTQLIWDLFFSFGIFPRSAILPFQSIAARQRTQIIHIMVVVQKPANGLRDITKAAEHAEKCPPEKVLWQRSECKFLGCLRVLGSPKGAYEGIRISFDRFDFARPRNLLFHQLGQFSVAELGITLILFEPGPQNTQSQS